MTWSPVNNTLLCARNQTLPECQPAALSFLAFLVQYFGHSHDQHFTDSAKSNDELDISYDFIIVGAGSAGCVLANRLSEVEDWKILLLEAGDEEPMIADVPSASDILAESSIDYAYKTQPELSACFVFDDKSCPWPRGKVMGGSSTINANMYVRGPKQDYDDWESLGNPGWSYKNVLPYFKKLEDLRIPHMADENPNTRATGGPQTVGYFPVKGKYSDIVIDGWKELGLEEIDYNSVHTMIGTARTQFTTIHGTRQSTNGAYIRPIRGRRSNLVIRTKTQVTKVIIDPRTKIALGVEYITGGKITKKVYAKREIILSAGAIDTPKLLMLSGIGPASELKEANIQVIKDSAVGKNLQDHFLVDAITFNLTKKHSVIGDYEDAKNDLTYWLSNHEGLASGVGFSDTTTFFQTQYDTKPGVPDIQVLFAGRMDDNKPYLINAYNDRASLLVGLLNPRSLGEIKLNKTDPTFSPPLMYANYMTHESDVNTIVAGIQRSRKLFDTKAFKDAGFIEQRKSGCDNYEYDSHEYWYCVSRRYTSTIFHPVGTCKMGPRSDPTAVVDSKLKVYGIEDLRVVDASIMPVLIRGNTNVPTIMIGEKGSDMIKEQWL